MVALARRLIVTLSLTAATTPFAQDFTVRGACRDGAPHGAYELHAADGQLLVAGAFNHGKRTGSFIFWTRNGTRVAHIPYDDDHMSGTLLLWYQQAGNAGEAPQKLQATFAQGHRNGVSRSWYPDGRPRSLYRYDNDQLIDARAWRPDGAPLADTEARDLAARDRAEDQKYYASLDAMIVTHPPACTDRPPASRGVTT